MAFPACLFECHGSNRCLTISCLRNLYEIVFLKNLERRVHIILVLLVQLPAQLPYPPPQIHVVSNPPLTPLVSKILSAAAKIFK